MSDKPDGTGLTVDLVLRPEWAVYQGIDKTLRTTGTNKGFQDGIDLFYTIPAGKRLYVVWIGWSAVAKLVADADKPQHCYIDLEDNTATVLDWGAGSGGSVILPSPMVLDAGHALDAKLYNYAGHNSDLQITVRGYEVTV